MRPLARRTLLRGAGGAAIALPFLEAMGTRRAHAATPRRFLVVYTPGGTVMENWQPRGTATEYTLGPILAPLEPFKHQLVFVQGLDMTVARLSGGDTNHGAGIQAFLTGFHNVGSGFAQGPSLDQVLAPTLSAGRKFKSIELAIRWGTGNASGGKPHQQSSINIQAPNQPVPPQLNPELVFQRLFTDVMADPTLLARRRARAKSILDDVLRQYTTMAARVGAEDRARLEAHMTKIRELEASLAAGAGAAAGQAPGCAPPRLGETAGYNSDANIPRTSRQMTDLMVMALACDLTGVGTLQWTDSEAKHTFPWLGLLDNHHGYQHDRGYQPQALTRIYTWYATQLEYLLRRLTEVKEADGRSLLDNTLVLWGSELQHPGTHAKTNMPFLLAGSAGGRIKPGRWLKYTKLPHNNLLLSLAQAFGLNLTSFGHRDHCTGPLAGLL